MKTATITVRVPAELKERAMRLGVNWSEEIRRFLEERVRQYELKQLLEEVGQRARRRRSQHDSVELIREDRQRR